MMKDPSGNKILKPINEKEFFFYEKLEELKMVAKDPMLDKLFPLFFGRLYLSSLPNNVPKHFVVMQNLTKVKRIFFFIFFYYYYLNYLFLNFIFNYFYFVLIFNIYIIFIIILFIFIFIYFLFLNYKLLIIF